MSRKNRDIIVNIVIVSILCIIAFFIGLKCGKDKHMTDSYSTLNRFYYADLKMIKKNRGVIQVEVNGRTYEIGYNDKIIDGSESLLVEVNDHNEIINVWNLVYRYEE